MVSNNKSKSIMVQAKLNGRFCVNECRFIIEKILLDLPMQHFHIGSVSQSLMFAIYQEIDPNNAV